MWLFWLMIIQPYYWGFLYGRGDMYPVSPLGLTPLHRSDLLSVVMSTWFKNSQLLSLFTLTNVKPAFNFGNLDWNNEWVFSASISKQFIIALSKTVDKKCFYRRKETTKYKVIQCRKAVKGNKRVRLFKNVLRKCCSTVKEQQQKSTVNWIMEKCIFTLSSIIYIITVIYCLTVA